MNRQLLEAYYDYAGERVRAGILDRSLDIAILDGKSVEEHVIEVLRAAGRLPEGWDGETDRVEPVPKEKRRAG